MRSVARVNRRARGRHNDGSKGGRRGRGLGGDLVAEVEALGEPGPGARLAVLPRRADLHQPHQRTRLGARLAIVRRKRRMAPRRARLRARARETAPEQPHVRQRVVHALRAAAQRREGGSECTVATRVGATVGREGGGGGGRRRPARHAHRGAAAAAAPPARRRRPTLEMLRLTDVAGRGAGGSAGRGRGRRLAEVGRVGVQRVSDQGDARPARRHPRRRAPRRLRRWEAPRPRLREALDLPGSHALRHAALSSARRRRCRGGGRGAEEGGCRPCPSPSAGRTRRGRRACPARWRELDPQTPHGLATR